MYEPAHEWVIDCYYCDAVTGLLSHRFENFEFSDGQKLNLKKLKNIYFSLFRIESRKAEINVGRHFLLTSSRVTSSEAVHSKFSIKWTMKCTLGVVNRAPMLSASNNICAQITYFFNPGEFMDRAGLDWAGPGVHCRRATCVHARSNRAPICKQQDSMKLMRISSQAGAFSQLCINRCSSLIYGAISKISSAYSTMRQIWMNSRVFLSGNSTVERAFWWRQSYIIITRCCASNDSTLNIFSVTLNVEMNYDRNYENLLNSVKVMPKILVVLFFRTRCR